MREQIKNINDESLRCTERNFLVITKSYTSDDYTGNSINIDIDPIIGHTHIIIEASVKGYGYFNAYTANGILKNGVEIPKQICNIGDTKIADEYTNEQQTTRIIIFSANNLPVDITIKIEKNLK